jgi:hypothetical protein
LQAVTNWNASIALEAAHSALAKVPASQGGQFVGFVWRMMIYPCVSEPVFVFQAPADPFMFYISSSTGRVCKTAVTNAHTPWNSTCTPDCYN